MWLLLPVCRKFSFAKIRTKSAEVFDTHRLLDFLLDGLEDSVAAERIIEISAQPTAFIERLVAFHQTRGEYAAALAQAIWLKVSPMTLAR